MMQKKLIKFQFLGHLRQIFSFVWMTNPYFTFGIISLEFLQGIFPVITAWITKLIFDKLEHLADTSNSQFSFINIFLGLIAFQMVINLVSNATNLWNRYLSNELERRLSLHTEEEVYRQILCFKGLSYFENAKYHDLFQMASYGLQMGTNQAIHTLTSLVPNLIMLLSFFSLIFFLNPLLLLMLFIANVPRLIQQLQFGQQRVLLKQGTSSQERLSFYLGQLLSSVSFAKEIRLFNLGNYFLDRFLNLKRKVQVEERSQEAHEIRQLSGLNFLSTIVGSMTYGFVIYQAYEGQISIGDVMLYTAALGSISMAIEGIVGNFASINEQILFFQQYDELRDLEPDLKLVDNPRSIPPLSKGIELKDISFRYNNNAPYILENFNLFIPAKQNIALVGLNGSGKTTLVKLLTRLYEPTEGQILWDNIDIREFDIDEFRQRIGAIFQDFGKYDLTARENIGFGRVFAVENIGQIQMAAAKAGMHDYILSLPEQYETIISLWLHEDGGGTDLSGGQWQKIALSRMFMRDADFMILDEPTAALDAEAENEIFSKFTDLIKNQTSLIISHRFSSVRMADIIAVLHDGKIVEYGSHTELIALGQIYKDLYSKQAIQYQEKI